MTNPPQQTSGQSGITSAVGLAIESSFRQVPLTGGANPYTIGISGTNPLRYCMIQPSTGIDASTEMNAKKEIDGTNTLRRITKQGNLYQGDMSLDVDPEGIYYFLLGLFGRDIQTTAFAATSTAGPSVYKHQFVPGLHAPSFTMEEDIGDHTNGKLSSGVLVSKVSLDLGATITAKCSLYAHRQIPNTYPISGANTQIKFGSTPNLLPPQMGGDGTKTVIATASPIFVDVLQGTDQNGPLTWAAATFGNQTGFAAAYILINGSPVTVTLLEGSSIDIDRKIDSRMGAGSGFDRSVVTLNELMVSGKLQFIYNDMTIPAANMDFSQVSVNILFVGQEIGTSGVNYMMEIHLPHVKLAKTPVGEGDSTLLISADFEAKSDDTYGYPISIWLWNTLSNASLAGSYIAPCVTLAAIVNNTSPTITVNTSAGFEVGDSVSILGANANPYTVSSIADGTHLTFGGNVQGNVATGASVQNLSRAYGPGGGQGWQNS